MSNPSRSNPIGDLLEKIDKVKEKLTSEEYKDIMEELSTINDTTKKVQFELFFSTVYYEVEHIEVYVKPQIRRIILEQQYFDYVPHQHEGQFFKVHYPFLIGNLSEENRNIIKNILYMDCRSDSYIDYSNPKAEMTVDNGDDFFYIRFLKGKMEDDDSSSETSED
jgi:hypothetical protein